MDPPVPHWDLPEFPLELLRAPGAAPGSPSRLRWIFRVPGSSFPRGQQECPAQPLLPAWRHHCFRRDEKCWVCLGTVWKFGINLLSELLCCALSLGFCLVSSWFLLLWGSHSSEPNLFLRNVLFKPMQVLELVGSESKTDFKNSDIKMCFSWPFHFGFEQRNLRHLSTFSWNKLERSWQWMGNNQQHF